MTATSPPATRTRVPPAWTAQLVLGAVLLAHLTIVEVQFFSTGTGKNSILTVAKFFGLHAATIMMLQLILIARLPWLDRRLGMDRLTRWHRWIGFTLFWTVLTHATLIVLGYTALGPEPFFGTFLALAGVVASLLGMLAAAIMLVVVASSLRWARRRMSYETWHGLHFALYLAITLALIHQLLEGTTFAATPLAVAHWWTAWALVLIALLFGRVIVPLRRNARHRFRVAGGGAGIGQRGFRARHRPEPGAAAGRRPGSSASGGSPGTTAGGRPIRSPCPRRRTGGRCG